MNKHHYCLLAFSSQTHSCWCNSFFRFFRLLCNPYFLFNLFCLLDLESPPTSSTSPSPQLSLLSHGLSPIVCSVCHIAAKSSFHAIKPPQRRPQQQQPFVGERKSLNKARWRAQQQQQKTGAQTTRRKTESVWSENKTICILYFIKSNTNIKSDSRLYCWIEMKTVLTLAHTHLHTPPAETPPVTTYRFGIMRHNLITYGDEGAVIG